MKTRLTALFALLTVLSIGSIAAANDDKSWYDFLFEDFCKSDETWCVGLELDWVGANVRVREMPFQIRNVPIHPDDDYASPEDQGPIDKLDYSMAGTLQVGATGYRRFFNDHLRLGASLLWVFPFTEDDRRNYTNAVGTDKRGKGAALTYATFRFHGMIPPLENRWADTFLNIMPKVFAEVPLIRRINLALGASASYFSVTAENGWDRYNKLEVHRQKTLGHFIPATAYLQFGPLRAGASYPLKISETSLGREARLQERITYYFGFRYTF